MHCFCKKVHHHQKKVHLFIVMVCKHKKMVHKHDEMVCKHVVLMCKQVLFKCNFGMIVMLSMNTNHYEFMNHEYRPAYLPSPRFFLYE